MKTYEQPTLPSQCAIVFGVPLDQQGFREALADPKRDFVRNCCSIWPLYRQEVVLPGESLIATVRSLGVLVTKDATPDSLTETCDAGASVVILVSHWAAGTVEFRSGMHPAQDVVNAIPRDYAGFIDLAICIPRPLALSLRDTQPDVLIRYTEHKVRPRLWFPYFELLFQRLAVGDTSYLNASKEVLTAFMTHS